MKFTYLLGLYVGLDGEYDGDVGEYDGDVGLENNKSDILGVKNYHKITAQLINKNTRQWTIFS